MCRIASDETLSDRKLVDSTGVNLINRKPVDVGDIQIDALDE
jgi:hypothetical protein